MKDNLEQQFRDLEGQFDFKEPPIGHFKRFEDKLIAQTDTPSKWNPKTWQWIVIAASLALFFGIFIGNQSAKTSLELADVSPKMEETQHFFMTSIQEEIEQINVKRTKENEQIIDDAFKQLKKIEENYAALTIELNNSNKDKRIIYAMIANFQQRIEVLQSLVEQLDRIEQLKINRNDETII